MSEADKAGAAEKKLSSSAAAKRDAKSEVLAEAASEFVFAVVGHIGSGTSDVARSFAELLSKQKPAFQTTILKARDVIEEWAVSESLEHPDTTSAKSIAAATAWQDLGDDMRVKTTDHAAVAKALIRKIREARAMATQTKVNDGEPVEPDGTPRAYILDALRHPAEVNLLHHLYQDAFVLIGVVCDSDVREARLQVKLNNPTTPKLHEFMKRDEKDDKKHGQQVAKTFQLADFYVDNTPDRFLYTESGQKKEENPEWDINEKLRRLVRIVSHDGIERPELSETAKARLLDRRDVVLQIVRESTLEALVQMDSTGSKRRLQDPASIAWNLSTTLFFKAGGRPWKLGYVRPRVCYIGLVFKLFPDSASDTRKACCGAQMFLDSGDGLVFRGTPGNYYNLKTKQFHLPEAEARALIGRVVSAYQDRDPDRLPPAELVIHGRTRFNTEEWRGFSAGAPNSKITTVRISETGDLRMYAPRDTPVLRGTALHLDNRRGFLWTKGFIGELGTYPGREVPKPLSVEVVSGDTDLATVMKDLLMLTKLNFNSCVYADGSPVTLRFADAVGEIITAVPERLSMHPGPPMPFKHYI